MMAQPSGWGSTQNAAALPVVDAFARNLLMKYGGRTDDIWAFHDMPGYRTNLQGAGFAGGNVANPFVRGTGNVALQGMGGGNTPSDPGGQNWITAQKIANFPAGMYKMYRGKQQAVQQQQRIKSLQTARQQKQQAQQTQQANQSQLAANTQAYNATFNPAMQYGMAYQAGATAAATPQPSKSSLAANTQLYNATFNPNLQYPLQYQKQLGTQAPGIGPKPSPTAQPPRKRVNKATVTFNPKTGQRQTKSGLIIPPGTTSI